MLAKLLLDEGYEVFGVVRRPPEAYTATLGGIADRLTVLPANLLDQESLAEALRKASPTEVFNLAAPSFVPRSWDEPVQTAEFAAVGVTAMLEAIREVDPTIRFYQASSSEIFGEPHRDTSDRVDTARAAYAVRRREGVRSLHLQQLSPPLRALRLLRDPLQPRVAAAPPRFPTAKGGLLRSGDLARARAESSFSVISTRVATGDTRRTTSARCGSCSSRTSRTTTSLRRA